MATKLPIALETTSQEILSKLGSGIGGGVIKSIQWGHQRSSDTTVNIAQVAPDRSIVLLNGGVCSTTTNQFDYDTAPVLLTTFNSTNFQVESSGRTGGQARFSWQVIEFT